jgi:hypothetical protein
MLLSSFLLYVAIDGGKQEGWKQICVAVLMNTFGLLRGTDSALLWELRSSGLLRIIIIQMKMGPIGRPETSAINYHYSLRNNSEERLYHILNGASLKSHIVPSFYFLLIYLTTASLAIKTAQRQVLGRVGESYRRGTSVWELYLS